MEGAEGEYARSEVVHLIARWLQSSNRNLVGHLVSEAARRIDGEEPSEIRLIRPGESEPYDRGEEAFVEAIVALGDPPEELLTEARALSLKTTEPSEMPFGATFGLSGTGGGRPLSGGLYGQGKNRRH